MNIYAIVLAAGKGTRINAKTIPKVLYPVVQKPIIKYVIKNLRATGLKNIILAIGFQGEKVKEALGDGGLRYVWQKKRLGTAHAVLKARPLLRGKKGFTLIVNGDHPLFSTQTFSRIIDYFKKHSFALVLATAVEDEHPTFGRILRNQKGEVIGIREAKDATPQELKIREKNPGIYAVDNQWLWRGLKKIKKSKVTGEYYITDLVEIAISEGKKVGAVALADPAEIKGINTLKELKEVEAILQGESP